MEFNRNQYFFTGLVLLLLGIQFRMVESYALTPEAAKIVQKVGQSPDVASAANPFGQAIVTKSVSPPDWLGWCLMSIGSVLILHSLAMKKPGG